MRLSVDDVAWTKVEDAFGGQWIRVVVLALPKGRVIVRPLFPGDVFGIRDKVFVVRREDIQLEEPSFDQVDATYEGGDEFAPA